MVEVEVGEAQVLHRNAQLEREVLVVVVAAVVVVAQLLRLVSVCPSNRKYKESRIST